MIDDFPAFLRKLDAEGIEPKEVRFVGVGEVRSTAFAPLSDADIYFSHGPKTWVFHVTWMKTSKGPAFIGISSWFKPKE